MSVFTHFDYEQMAAESEQRLAVLKAGLEKVRDSPARCKEEVLAKNAKCILLKEQIYEEHINLNLFRRRAKERSGL